MADARNVVILGGGIAGITAANLLSDHYKDVLLVEGNDRLGGTHKSLDAGGFTFDIGSFFFYSSYLLFDLHPEMLQITKPAPYRQQRIAPDGVVRNYPFSPNELRDYSFRTQLACGLSLLKSRILTRSPGNLEAECHRLLGRVFYKESGLSNYVARFYGVDFPGSRISRSFVEKRMKFLLRKTKPLNALKTILTGLGTDRSQKYKPADRKPSEVPRVRPEEGFEVMYDHFAEALVHKGVEIQLKSPVRSIAKRGDVFELTTDRGLVLAEQVISSMPIAPLVNLIGEQPTAGLQSGSLLTLCISFAGDRGFEAGVLYNFHASGHWKRLTMHSDFYGSRKGREYFSVEVPLSDASAISEGQAFADFKNTVQSNGLFQGDLRLEEAVVTPFAYPRYEIGYEAALERAFEQIDDFGIVTLGRQGRFDYLPTSGAIASQVQSILRPILSA